MSTQTQVDLSPFAVFNQAMQAQFSSMISSGEKLYLTTVDKDQQVEKYLNSFADEINPIFRKRRSHDCSCCKRFIKQYGNLVTIKDGNLVSIWDFKVDNSHYQAVADTMAKFVKSKKIYSPFYTKDSKLGTKENVESTDSGDIIWEHLFYKLPKAYTYTGHASIEEVVGKDRESKAMIERALTELTTEAVDIVLELIGQNSLYRGKEHEKIVKDFKKLQSKFKKVAKTKQDNFYWSEIDNYCGRIRNSVIGTLLVDLSDGKDLENSVGAYEAKVAPENYKRPTALITKGMIKQAQTKVKELGFEESLPRRHATIDDITVNNILFANRKAQKDMNVFDVLGKEVPENPKKMDKIEEVSFEDFTKNILPNATNIELLLENKHENHLVSLIAPENSNAPSMFKWDNGFSWSYNGDTADSIKERVKAAKGNVNGVLRVSLAWTNHDDLDLHIIEPHRNEIYFGSKRSGTSGFLDVDMNAGGRMSDEPVENIAWTDKNKMVEGDYRIVVHNYTKRDTKNVGFDIEIEYEDGSVYNFHSDKSPAGSTKMYVVQFNWTKKNGLKILTKLDGKMSQKEIWGVKTNTFVPVSVIMNSPNYWDDLNGLGNKHLFFMLENCKNKETPRGFFNEFLNNDLTPHRKVFEALGSKMKVRETEDQLSGVGFSTTKKESITLKVEGAFNRTVKVNF